MWHCPLLSGNSCIFREATINSSSHETSAIVLRSPRLPQKQKWGRVGKSKAAVRRSEAQGCAKSCASPCRAAQGARHHDEAHTHQRIRPFDGAGGNDVYEPEKVLASHLARGVTQYLVKWAGYESKDNTWEPIENLAGCEDMIAEFTEREKTHMGRTGCAMWRTAPGVPRGLGGPGPGTGYVIWQLTGVCYLAVNWV